MVHARWLMALKPRTSISASISDVKVSACVMVGNEERNIRDCLNSISWADEIIVVDSFSEDNTVAICREYTDKIYQREWPGFAGQRECSISLANNEWVLCIDADERISSGLRDEIHRELAENERVGGRWDGFSLPRRAYYIDRWINHSGFYPSGKLRLFRKSKVHVTGPEPHDKCEVIGPTKRLKNDIIHFPYRGLAHQIDTLNSFSTICAENLRRRGQEFSLMKMLFKPPARFLRDYICKAGFRDGLPGLFLGVLAAYNVFVRYAKLRELNSSYERPRELRRNDTEGQQEQV